MFDLYTASTPNGYKVSVALEELALPYRVHPMNLQRPENRPLARGLAQDAEAIVRPRGGAESMIPSLGARSRRRIPPGGLPGGGPAGPTLTS